jgi:hypothetical protein
VDPQLMRVFEQPALPPPNYLHSLPDLLVLSAGGARHARMLLQCGFYAQPAGGGHQGRDGEGA